MTKLVCLAMLDAKVSIGRRCERRLLVNGRRSQRRLLNLKNCQWPALEMTAIDLIKPKVVIHTDSH